MEHHYVSDGFERILVSKPVWVRTLEEEKKKEADLSEVNRIFFHLQWSSMYAEVQQMVPMKFILGK